MVDGEVWDFVAGDSNSSIWTTDKVDFHRLKHNSKCGSITVPASGDIHWHIYPVSSVE